MKNNQKGFSAIEGLLALILIVLVGFVVWYVSTASDRSRNTSNNAKKSNVEETSADTGSYTGWQTFMGSGYSVKYPQDWKAYAKGQNMPVESDPGGTSSITATNDYFQNPKDGVGSIAFTVSVDNYKLGAEAYLEETFPNGQAPQGEITNRKNFKTKNGYPATTYTLKFQNTSYKTAVSNGSKVIFFDCSSDQGEIVDKVISTLDIKP